MENSDDVRVGLSAAQARIALVVGAILIGATAVSWWVGGEHGLGRGSALVVSLIGLAFGKAWLIGWYFMEIRRAAITLQIVFSAVVAATGAGVLIIALTGYTGY